MQDAIDYMLSLRQDSSSWIRTPNITFWQKLLFDSVGDRQKIAADKTLAIAVAARGEMMFVQFWVSNMVHK